MLGGLNAWYVKGDNGLLEDFIAESISHITKAAFKEFHEEIDEQKRLEEEERVNAEVEKFRVYNLRLKFFYRWKRNAREKRLREVRRKGREEMRAFYAARRAAERDAKKATADDVERPGVASVPSKRPEEFMDLVKAKRTSRREVGESLLATGVLSGVVQEQEAAKMIVGGGSRWSDRSQSMSSQSLEPSRASPKEGPKTRALRRLYFDQPARFRRSLPSLSSGRDSPDDRNRSSNVSWRWRLKTMGIVQLPDGTAVPESLANEVASGMPLHATSAASGRARRVSATDASEVDAQRFISSSSWPDGSSAGAAGDSPPTNKRKKPDDESGIGGSAKGSAHKRIMSSTESAAETPMSKRKRFAGDGEETRDEGDGGGRSYRRIMSDAEKIRAELRALRAELEEDTKWFKAQNERLRSESRTGTPWYDDST